MNRIVTLPHEDADVSDQFELGMCYTVTWDDGASVMIFRHDGSAITVIKPGTHDDGRNRNRCYTDMLLSPDSERISKESKPWVVDRHCKRSTVEEEIWYDECKRVGHFMEKNEALEIFEKKYEI